MSGPLDFLGGLFSAGASIYNNSQNNALRQSLANQANAFNAQQAEIGRQFSAQQADITRSYNSAEAEKAREFNTSERQAQDTFLDYQANRANEWSKQAQAEAERYNSEEAQKNRDFQQMMSSTAYQRAMQDMKAAGLNPILAYQQGGAGTPGGSSASVGGYSGAQAGGGYSGGPSASAGSASAPIAHGAVMAHTTPILEGAISSAMEAMKLPSVLKQLEGEAENSQYKRNVTESEADLLRARREQVNKATEILGEQKKVAEVEARKAEIDLPWYESKFGTFSRGVRNTLDNWGLTFSNANQMARSANMRANSYENW